MIVAFLTFSSNATAQPIVEQVSPKKPQLDDSQKSKLGDLLPYLESGEFGLIPLDPGINDDQIPEIIDNLGLLYCPNCYPGGSKIPGMPKIPPLPIPEPTPNANNMGGL